jgi:nitrile hydratase subunit beta
VSDDLGRFREGDPVRVLEDVPDGNPRTPHYLRGHTGTVVRRHGVVVNPLDHREPYPPLYSVVFQLADGDEVLADLHDEWLTPAE